MFRLLITGSRIWVDKEAIAVELRKVWKEHGSDVTLISGACPDGADAICENLGKLAGWIVETHPAEWNKYGRCAGYKRNAEMVLLGADMCLAFIKNESKGATHTATYAEKRGINTIKVTA